MRRHQGEITLMQFVEDMPKEVYEAIRLHGDKDHKAMEERRKVMGIVKSEGAVEADKRVRFKDKRPTKKIRRRQVMRDLPPSDRDECKAVLDDLVARIIEDQGEKRALSPWISCDVELEAGGVDGEDIKGKAYIATGDMCVFEFIGEAVLPKAKPDLTDDKAMDRFDRVLEEVRSRELERVERKTNSNTVLTSRSSQHGATFDQLLDEFLGSVDVDDSEAIIDACTVGLMERRKLDGRENYLEIKKKLDKALMVPLEFEKLQVVMREGRIVKILYEKAHEGGGEGEDDKWKVKEYVLDDFQKRAMVAGYR